MQVYLACSLLGARTKGIRAPLGIASVLLVVGGMLLLFTTGNTPLAVLLLAGACFGVPQGLMGTSNQAAVQSHAPADAIGSAAGLQRTAQYIGAIAASGLIGLAYGQRADDAAGKKEVRTMTATTLDATTALVLVDLQKGITAPARGGDVSADWADLVPELGRRDGDIVVTKQQWGAFYGTDLDLQLRRRGVTQVVVAGSRDSVRRTRRRRSRSCCRPPSDPCRSRRYG